MNDTAEDMRGKIKRLREIRYAAETEDFSDVSDGLSASDDFAPLCLELAEEVVEREAQAETIESLIKDLQARKARVTRSAETLRNVILQCMEIRAAKTIPSPGLTLSVSSQAPDIVVTDESAVPSRFFAPQPPKLDRKALRSAVMEDGEVIDGVSLGNGKIKLMIRRK